MTRDWNINEGKNIPEAVQAPIRERLRLLRNSRGINQGHFTAAMGLSASALITYEVRNVSTMQLGHIWVLAKEFDVPFRELILYLLDQDSTDNVLSEDGRRQRTLSRTAARLSPANQETLIEIADVILANQNANAKTAAKVLREVET